MVKKTTKIILPLILLTIFCFSGCNVDWLGFVTSSDLDDRLKSKDSFVFLDDASRNWRSLTLEPEYSFVVLTDTHIEDGKDFDLKDKISKVISENAKIKFVVILGDITQTGAEKDILKFIEVADSFGVPCYPVIGNHDIYFGNWPYWRDNIGSTMYRVDGDGLALIILDSANSFFGKEQLDWLERQVNNAAGKRVFVFTHSPLFVTGPVDLQQITDTKERARIVSMLKNKCDIMFMGHSHKRVENETGNVKYISIEDFKSKKVYCLVSVSGSGVSYEFFKL
ncbi:MAG: metallophosphoesterase [Treponema sp.]|nr:metallophosphoesterase [Treponema sp.]